VSDLVKIKKQPNTLYLGVGKAADKLARLAKVSEIARGGTEEVLKGLAEVEVSKAPRPDIGRRTSHPKLLGRRGRTLRVGIWDIDVHAGFLYRVLDRINKCQTLFSFHPIEVTAPVGLTETGERTRELVRANELVRTLGLDTNAPSIADNTLASDIFAVAAPIRKKLQLDLLAALVAPMIMDLEPDPDDGKVGWNYFSTSRDSIAIVSAYELRRYAEKSQRPFEACLAMLIVPQILQETIPTLSFHEKPKGCVFDECEDRNDIVKGLKTMRLCKESLDEVPEQWRGQVQKIFKAIAEYKR